MTTASKYRLGAGALVLASAVAAFPGVAQAYVGMPEAPSLTIFSGALGSAAGQGVCNILADADCAAALAAEPLAAVEPTADNPLSILWQNNIFWTCLDCQNPVYQASNPITVSEWTPLSIFPWLPDVFPGLWQLWANQSSETCFLGWSTSLGGPYAEPGQFKTQFSSKGCNGGFFN